MKPTRISALIPVSPVSPQLGEVDAMLMVQDAKDKGRPVITQELLEKKAKFLRSGRTGKAEQIDQALEIVKGGRFCLPGGKIERADYEAANALGLIGKVPQTQIERDDFLQVISHTIARECMEELGLGVSEETIRWVAEIQGKTRHHLVCILSAQGKIKLNRDELSGLGLLTERPIIPLRGIFYQKHVLEMHQRFFGEGHHELMVPYFVSRVGIERKLLEQWYENLEHGWAYSRLGGLDCDPIPPFPRFSANFQVYDHDGTPYQPANPTSLTNVVSRGAKIVPPDPDRLEARAEQMLEERRKKKSDPAMTAVRPEDQVDSPGQPDATGIYGANSGIISQLDDEGPDIVKAGVRDAAVQTLKKAVGDSDDK